MKTFLKAAFFSPKIHLKWWTVFLGNSHCNNTAVQADEFDLGNKIRYLGQVKMYYSQNGGEIQFGPWDDIDYCHCLLKNPNLMSPVSTRTRKKEIGRSNLPSSDSCLLSPPPPILGGVAIHQHTSPPPPAYVVLLLQLVLRHPSYNFSSWYLLPHKDAVVWSLRRNSLFLMSNPWSRLLRRNLDFEFDNPLSLALDLIFYIWTIPPGIAEFSDHEQ